MSQTEIAAAEIALADTQLVIAREPGFSSRPKPKSHVQSLSVPVLSAHEPASDDKVKDGVAELQDVSLNRLAQAVKAESGRKLKSF